MTELEWLACTDPADMLRFLRGRAGDRKLRLFAIACCRHVWHLFDDERSRLAVEASERYVEGMISRDELRRCQSQARAATMDFWRKIRKAPGSLPNAPARQAVAECAAEPLLAARVAGEASTACVWAGSQVLEVMRAAKEAEKAFQCDLLRDLFGNPFRPVAGDPSAWPPEAVALAETIYDHRSFERLPELAQVLQEAGCTQADLLSHLRGAGQHARGCWALDRILSKDH
jgi:hypothetical protein